MVFSNEKPVQVALPVHATGTAIPESYVFVPETTVPWRWQEMVANLDKASLQAVCSGLAEEGENRSRGIVKCILRQGGVYDHKRHASFRHAKIAVDGTLLTWDFWLVTDLGKEVGLHPNHGNNKVACYKGATTPDLEVPPSGKGGRGKPGFQNIINRQVHSKLRFQTYRRRQYRAQPAAGTTPSQPQSRTAAGSAAESDAREANNRLPTASLRAQKDESGQLRVQYDESGQVTFMSTAQNEEAETAVAAPSAPSDAVAVQSASEMRSFSDHTAPWKSVRFAAKVSSVA